MADAQIVCKLDDCARTGLQMWHLHAIRLQATDFPAWQRGTCPV